MSFERPTTPIFKPTLPPVSGQPTRSCGSLSMASLHKPASALWIGALICLVALDASAQQRSRNVRLPGPSQSAQAQQPPSPTRGELQLGDQQRARGRYHMDFDKVDIIEVIKYISQWTNRNFILPDNVRGKITIIGPADVSADEAYAAFLAALETNNLTVTPSGKFLKIVPKKDSIRTSIPTYLEDQAAVPLDERMVTKLFRLKYNESDPIRNVLQQFITREGEIVPFPPDVLIVSDVGLNIHRLERILEQLDQPGSHDEINVMQVEHANVQELSNMLLQIFQQQGSPSQSTSTARRGPTASTVPTTASDSGGEAGTPSVSKIIPDERTNKLIIIASARSFLRIRELIRKLDVPTDAGQIHVYYLENANAEELAGTLSSLASSSQSPSPTPGRRRAATPAAGAGSSQSAASMFGGDVRVTADTGTNSLLIIASPSDYRAMVRVIERLDIRRKQVFIEAVIMEVKINSDTQFDVDFHTGYALDGVSALGADSGTAPILVGSQPSGPGKSLGLGNLASLSGFLAGIQGPPIRVPGLDLSLPSFGVVLNALQRDSNVNVISTPHILTSDNEEAEITVGSNVPFQAAYMPSLGGLGGLGGLSGSNANGLGLSSSLGLGLGGLGSLYAPIQRQPVELVLRIKPQVNESDYVRLEVDEQLEEISSIDRQLGPTTAKRSVKTVVVARDQSTVVIGGLIQDRTTRADTRVPILGSIPVIGALFRSSNSIKEKTNLLLFLTPYIIRDQSDFRRIFERKMAERQEFVSRFFGEKGGYEPHIDYERKRGPLATLRNQVNEERQRAENGGPGLPGQTIIYSGEEQEFDELSPSPADRPANSTKRQSPADSSRQETQAPQNEAGTQPSEKPADPSSPNSESSGTGGSGPGNSDAESPDTGTQDEAENPEPEN